MSLSLSRKPGQSIRIGRDVVVTVTETRSGRTRVRIDAPDDVRILRGELSADDDSGSRRDESGKPRPELNRAEAEPSDAAIGNVDSRSGRVVKFPKPSERSGCVLRLAPVAERLDALAQGILRLRARRRGDSGPGLIPVC